MVEPFTLAASAVAAAAVSALVAARVSARSRRHPESDAGQMAACAVCGETGSRSDIDDHLVSVHHAPGGSEDRAALIQPVEADA